MKAFFNEAYTRLISSTPVFFKKLGKVGVAAAASGGAMITPEIAGAHFPLIVSKIGAHLLTAGAIIKAVSHFAVDDSTNSNNGQK
jgi:hypothetical protein